MKAIFLICALSVACLAQYNGLAPITVQSCSSGIQGNSADSCTFGQNSTSGNVIYGLVGYDSAVSGRPISISDANGHATITMDAEQGPVTSQTSPGTTGSSGSAYGRTFCGTVNSTGSVNLVTSSGSIQTRASAILVAFEAANSTCTEDGSPQFTIGTSGNTSTPAALSQNITTGINGDLIVNSWFTAGGNFGNVSAISTPPLLFAVDLMSEYIAGTVGTYANTIDELPNFSCVVGPCHEYIGLNTIAYKPVSSGIVGVTTVMHQAINGQFFSDTLLALGGTSALTYSLSSGCLTGTGLSFNSSTGVISGTHIGNSSITCSYTATDGTSTSSAQSFTINVGCGAATPTVIASATGGNGLSGWTFSSGIQALDVIDLSFAGMNSHCNNGYMETTPSITDTAGSTIRRVDCRGNFGPAQDSMHYLLQIPAGYSGTSDTISLGANGGGSAVGGVAMQIRGVQSIADVCAYVTSLVSPSSLTTPNLTTPVANEFLRATAFYNAPSGPTFNSPFSVVNHDSFSCPSFTPTQYYATDQASSIGNYSATANATGGSLLEVTLYGLRPSALSCQVIHHREMVLDQF